MSCAPRRNPSSRRRPNQAEMLRTLARGAVAAGLALSVVLSSCQVLNQSTAANGAQGRIVWAKDGDLWVYDLGTRQQTKITNLSAGAAVTGATWSPDGQRVIFAQFWRRP